MDLRPRGMVPCSSPPLGSWEHKRAGRRSPLEPWSAVPWNFEQKNGKHFEYLRICRVFTQPEILQMKIWFNGTNYFNIPAWTAESTACTFFSASNLPAQCARIHRHNARLRPFWVEKLFDLPSRKWLIWFSPEQMQKSKSMTIPHSPTSTQLQ